MHIQENKRVAYCQQIHIANYLKTAYRCKKRTILGGMHLTEELIAPYISTNGRLFFVIAMILTELKQRKFAKKNNVSKLDVVNLEKFRNLIQTITNP